MSLSGAASVTPQAPRTTSTPRWRRSPRRREIERRTLCKRESPLRDSISIESRRIIGPFAQVSSLLWLASELAPLHGEACLRRLDAEYRGVPQHCGTLHL